MTEFVNSILSFGFHLFAFLIVYQVVLLALCSTQIRTLFRLDCRSLIQSQRLLICLVPVASCLAFAPSENFQFQVSSAALHENTSSNSESLISAGEKTALFSANGWEFVSSVSTSLNSILVLFVEVAVPCIGLLLLGAFALSVFKWIGKLRLLSVSIESLIPIRRFGRVTVFAGEHDDFSAFAFIKGRLTQCVVLSEQTLCNPSLQMAVLQHELSHIKNRDTFWAHINCIAFQVVHSLFRSQRLQEKIAMLEEERCDFSVVQKGSLDASQYCSLLLEAAVLRSRSLSVSNSEASTALCLASDLTSGWFGAFFNKGGQKKSANHLHLNERFRVFEIHHYKESLMKRIGFIVVVGVAFVCTSVGIANEVGSQSVSMTHTSELAERIAERNIEREFPIDLNTEVIKRLNAVLASEKGKRFFRNSLSRKDFYQAELQHAREVFSLPEEIESIPIVESGYRNLSASKNAVGAAGVWQFMAQTAQRYGLVVSNRTDERLEFEKATFAAMRLLESDHAYFGDWRLAVLSYNAGRQAIDRAIAKTGSRDPWVLVSEGHEGDKGYLSRVMVAVLISEFPEWVE